MDDEFVGEKGAARLILAVGARDHLQGLREAAVTLVEYGDFECEHCAAVFLLMMEIKRWLRDELCYVFRHFPVAGKHPRALQAAEAAEAAGAQGRFWEMHDLLCEHSPALGEVHLNRYARELGLDLERFERGMREHIYMEKVLEDFKSGVASGVTGTPAFFINGVRYKGDPDLDSLLAAIEEAGNRALGDDQ